jgi:hypothetical protein
MQGEPLKVENHSLCIHRLIEYPADDFELQLAR